ncbi:hypothetical protein G4B88_002379 (mitochondrion) [Cannabis sativa]|uniref:Retrotransposon gag domain-containing protein n=1 Tax=Cannabis sativa TaxID=3483 RepID=A0A7J6DV26_CANSA|nr:hypothetical protein G4B88_002379 [Cannabis sativa]
MSQCAFPGKMWAGSAEWGTGPAFTWYAHLSEESIPTWEARVSEFRKQFSNTQRRVGVPEQLKTKQRDNEPVTEFIARWRAPTFACPQKFTQQELLKMCMNNFRHDLSSILLPQTRDSPPTAHDVEAHLSKRRRPTN